MPADLETRYANIADVTASILWLRLSQIQESEAPQPYTYLYHIVITCLLIVFNTHLFTLNTIEKIFVQI